MKKEREGLERKYKEQRDVVKKLIREGITKYEIQITNEIKEDRNSGRKLWQNINKLIGRKSKVDEEMKVFNEEGKELNEQEIKIEVPKFWREYLGKEINEISQVWNEEKSKEMKAEMERMINYEPNFVILPGGVFKIEQSEQKITPMKIKEIGKDVINGELEKLKSKKKNTRAKPDKNRNI